MAGKKDLCNLRDCVRLAFENGSGRGHEFEKMRHAIIVELKRLGYTSAEIKGALLVWNKRCEKVLSHVEQKRQLLDYLEWVDKQEAKSKTLRMGCRALEDYCIGEEKCLFNVKKLSLNRESTEIAPFDLSEVEKFLESRYKGPTGYTMFLILKNLRHHQIKKGTGPTIFIGHKGIATLLSENDGHRIELMTINRGIKNLVNEEMIEIVVKGEKGTFSPKANGYRLLPWRSTQIYSN